MATLKSTKENTRTEKLNSLVAEKGRRGLWNSAAVHVFQAKSLVCRPRLWPAQISHEPLSSVTIKRLPSSRNNTHQPRNVNCDRISSVNATITLLGRKHTVRTLWRSGVARPLNVLANVRYLLSPVRLSPVCLSSVTLVHPTQAVVIFGNFSMAFGTLATHPHKILWRSFQGNPSAGGVKTQER